MRLESEVCVIDALCFPRARVPTLPQDKRTTMAWMLEMVALPPPRQLCGYGAAAGGLNGSWRVRVPRQRVMFWESWESAACLARLLRLSSLGELGNQRFLSMPLTSW
jgi:hypothetical protein